MSATMMIDQLFGITAHIKGKEACEVELFYHSPAANWNQALPLGNGHLGVMVHGETKTRLFDLNDDTFWTGYPRDRNYYMAYPRFLEARHMAEQGKLHEAETLLERGCEGLWSQCYQPAGQLLLELENGTEEIAEYCRSLSLDDAIHRVRFQAGSQFLEEECFVSAPADTFLYRCISTGGTISGIVRLSSLLPHETWVEQGGILVLQQRAPGESETYCSGRPYDRYVQKNPLMQGMRCRILAKVQTVGGILKNASHSLQIMGAQEIEIRLCIHTSFAGYSFHPVLQGLDEASACQNTLTLSLQKNYDTLKAEHLEDYQELYTRLELDLGDGRQELPTDQRLLRYQGDDNQLVALLCQYGRYLTIAASRPGTQPMNLQGIWNPLLTPPWSSNYTLNINTEMNYWPTLMANLEECHQPFLQMIEELRDTGSETAAIHYGARGFCAHHNSDLWRMASPVGGWPLNHQPRWAYFPLAGAWAARQVWEQYWYTMDRQQLEYYGYPILKDAALFCADLLTEREDGFLWACPATSPEHSFWLDGSLCAVSGTSTIFLAIIYEALDHFIYAAHLLNRDAELRKDLEEKRNRLLPLSVGSKGQLLEWDQEYQDEDPNHRHISHLYPLMPGQDITPEDTPELAQACVRSLELRGEDGTGWSLGWKVNAWARLGKGETALRLLDTQLRPVEGMEENYCHGGSDLNLLCAHPPFQIDGNFAATAGILQMLLQSRPGRILLLPALPSRFKNGSVTGLKAMGGLQVDLIWADGLLEQADLSAKTDGDFLLCYQGHALHCYLSAGSRLSVTLEDFLL